MATPPAPDEEEVESPPFAEPAYPSNDITSEIQAGTITALTEDSVFHQTSELIVDLDLNGYTLQVYGGPGLPARTVYGRTCTGPAAYFLDADGNPIGYPGASHPAGVQFSPLTVRSKPNIDFGGGVFDDNIRKKPQTNPTLSDGSPNPYYDKSTDAWAGAVLMPYLPGTGLNVHDLKIINAFGGHYWYPDPLHIELDDQVVSNYKMGSCAIPTVPTTHGGVPGGLIQASGSQHPTGVSITDADLTNGFFETDGYVPGEQIKRLTTNHCLLAGPGDWQGAVWDDFKTTLDNGVNPSLEFSASGVITGLQIENSKIAGIIANAQNFQGVWGPNNVPAVLPSGTGGAGGGPIGRFLLGLGIVVGVGAAVWLDTHLPRPAPRYRAPPVPRVVA